MEPAKHLFNKIYKVIGITKSQQNEVHDKVELFREIHVRTRVNSLKSLALSVL